MDNEEDETASNALHNSPHPRLELDLAPATIEPQSREQGETEILASQCDSESVLVHDPAQAQLAGAVPVSPHLPADGEDEGRVAAVEEAPEPGNAAGDEKDVVDVISREQESQVELEIGVGSEVADEVDEEAVEVGVGEEMEWADLVVEREADEEQGEGAEGNTEVDGIEHDTEVDDVGEDTVMPSAGMDTKLNCASLQTDIVTHIDVADSVLGTAEEDVEVADDNSNDTEMTDVGQDVHFVDTGNETAHAAEEAEETEVADAAGEAEKTEVADAAGEAEKTEVADDAEGAEKTEVADDEGAEETAVANVIKETELADVVAETDDAEELGLAEAADETEVANVTEEKELADVVEETEVADDAEQIELDEAAGETELGDDAEEIELGDVAEEAEVADAAEEAEDTEVADVSEETVMEEAVKNGGKRKRGRIPKAVARVLKKGEEDVCFICFDGGELVLCDRRGCPKAYHPACVNRDEAFFRAKGRWNCGWHLCSSCEKNAHYMCYTCTFSLCKACIKGAVILCVKGNKGFCEACMKTVLMIEQKEQQNQEMPHVNFDDKSSWEYLFKDYWIDLKERLHLTVDDVTSAKNPCKGSHVHASKQESPDELYDGNDDGGQGSDTSGNTEASLPKKRKLKKRLKSRAKVADSSRKVTASAERVKDDGFQWVSNELLEFVMHMRNGNKSVLSQFDIQALLLEYIKANKLRDPRRKSQIICDQRLVNLFGKQRVGHFEMLKLLESHFHVRENSQADDLQGSVVDTEAQLDAYGTPDASVKAGKDKKRKRKNSRVPQSNLDDYAAIDMHNISLIYLRRNLLEDLIEDTDNFDDKVVGTFVRIRIAGAQKQDMYRLVQVVGTSKAAEPYKVGKKMTHTLLEILNLDKIEVLSIDIISNQEFTEDECKRLRQSIKCGLINRLTVGDIQEKAMVLQAARVKDWFETEIVRLNHLRDRASDLGKKKQLRECVEKLQLLKTPEERQRRLEEIPEIHVDPNMDPNYESEEDEEADDKNQDHYLSPRGTAFGRKGREPISPRTGGSASSDSWSGTRNYSSMNRESSRSMSTKGLFNKGDDAGSSGEIVNDNVWSQRRDTETPLNSHEKPKIASMVEAASRNINSAAIPSSFSGSVVDISAPSLSTSVAQTTVKVNETEKMWHYRDPSGKVQGPFSIVQLRKWNKSGYFPTELRIWKASEKEDDSILLTDALAGKFQKEPPVPDNSLQKVQTTNSPQLSSYSGKPHVSHLDQNRATLNPHGSLASSGRSVGENWRAEPENSSLKSIAAPSVEIPKYSAGGLRSDYNGTRLTNLPSPTPTQHTPGGTVVRSHENKWSPNSFPVQSAGPVLGTNELLHAAAMKESRQLTEPAIDGSSISQGAFSQQKNVPGNKVQNVVPSNFGQSMGSSENETNSYQMSGAPSESHRVQGNANLLQAPNSSEASISLGPDSKNFGANLQNLIESVSSQVRPAGAHGWGSGVVANQGAIPSGPVAGSESQAWAGAPSQKLEPNNMTPNSVQQPLYGHYGNAPSSAPSFSAGNPTGVFPTSGFSGLPQSSGPWRPPISSHQPNNMPSGGANQQNNMSSVAAAHQPNHQLSVAPNSPWVGPVPGNPNMGWMGLAPGNSNWGPSGQVQPTANANPSWAPPGQGSAPGNTNSGWTAPGQPGQGSAPGNTNSGWTAPGQGPRPVNGNQAWIAPGQGPLPGNPNSGWSAPTGNSGMWGSDQSHNNGDRFSGQRNPGYGGGKPWNNNGSGGGGGGGGSRPRVCRFHESGHCKKGSSCNFMHP